jgi:hypothetical protein
MAEATTRDDSLEDFIGDYHPTWDGFVELRMYLGTADEQAYSYHYPALDIQVTGDTWHAVGGGPVNCDAGSAESIETILLPKSTTSPRSTTTTTRSTTGSTQGGASAGTAAGSGSHAGGGPSAAAGTAAAGSPASAGPSAVAGATTGPGSDQRSASAVLADSPRSSADPWIWLAVIAALLVLAGSGVLIARRRRPAVVRSLSETTPDSHKKG